MEYQIVKGDLFNADLSSVLVHCVSADFAMGAGIAQQFTHHFPSMREELLVRFSGHSLDSLIGTSCLWYDHDVREGQMVVNLITKKNYWDKPTLESLRSSLSHSIYLLEEYFQDFNFNVAMPKIGCGLDRLQWNDVEKIIKAIFNQCPSVTVFER